MCVLKKIKNLKNVSKNICYWPLKKKDVTAKTKNYQRNIDCNIINSKGQMNIFSESKQDRVKMTLLKMKESEMNQTRTSIAPVRS